MLTDRVLRGPPSMPNLSVTQVYVAQAARMVRGDRAALRRIFLRASLGLLATSATSALAAVALAHWGFEAIFGAEWSAAATYVAIFAPVAAVEGAVGGLDGVSELLQRQEIAVGREAARGLLTLAGMLAARSRWHDARCAFAGMAAGATLGYAVSCLMSLSVLGAAAPRAPGVGQTRATPRRPGGPGSDCEMPRSNGAAPACIEELAGRPTN
jgi:hypothetical protein